MKSNVINKLWSWMKLSTFIFPLSTMIASCENQDFVPQERNDAVKIKATIGALQTRVAYGVNGTTTFEANDQIRVENTLRSSKNVATYTMGSDDQWTTSDAMVWNGGTDENNQFNAWYPATASYTEFVIPADQSLSGRLASADWMTATTGAMTKPEDGELYLDFQHRLAKVTVSFTRFSTQFSEDVSLRHAFFHSLGNESVTVQEGSDDKIDALTDGNSMTAIVCPGKYGADAEFMTITVLDSDEETEHIVPANRYLQETGLEAGKHYTFSLIVGKDVVSFSSVSVMGWDEMEIEGGEAEEVIPNTFDATAMTPEQLNAAVTEALEYGHTTLTVNLAEDADASMFSAITSALAATIDPSLDHWELSQIPGTIDLTISGAKKVFDSAFCMLEYFNENWRGCTILKTLTLPDVTEIEAYGINCCPHLTSVSAPKCEVLGEGALAENEALTAVYLPAARIIGNCADGSYGPFCMCDNLTEIALPEATTLGDSAFSGCSNLKTVYLPKVTEIIGNHAFRTCYNLEEITLGALTAVNNRHAGTFDSETTENVHLVLSSEQKVMTYNNSTMHWTAGTEAFDFTTTSFIGYTFKSITPQE